MKKLYFSILTFLASLTIVNAQVFLTQTNHAPTVGDSVRVYQVDSTSTSPGASGSGAVWTFTGSAYTRTNLPITNTYTTPVSITSGSLYPSATVVLKNNTLKNFYSSTSSQLNFWGGNFSVSTFNIDYFFSSPAIHASYLMAFNTTTTSVFTGSLQFSTTSGAISAGTSTVTADGTGTLHLPNRSFSNVLRVNTYTGFNFSIPTLLASGNVKQQTWDYYSSLTSYPSTKIVPLFQIVTSTVTANLTIPTPTTIVNTSTVVLLNRDYEYVGISENSSEVAELNIFPNPTDNNFNLIFVNENASDVKVEVFNTIGQVVQKETFSGSKGVSAQNVDVTKLEAGVYFVKVNVGKKSSVKKLTIQ